MTTHSTIRDLLNQIINSKTLTMCELIIHGRTYYGIVLADKTAIVPFGDYYELCKPREYVIKSEVASC